MPLPSFEFHIPYTKYSTMPPPRYTRKKLRVASWAINDISRKKHIRAPTSGVTGNSGVLNGRFTSGLANRRYTTVTHTIANANNVPTFVRLASWSRPMKPAKPHAMTPTISVLIQGVWYFGCTLANAGGIRPSRAIV